MKIIGSRVLITGASTGIGKAIAKEFIKKGAKVIVLGRNKPNLKVEFHQVDVSQEDQIKSALEKINKLDVVINNAGIAIVNGIEKASTEELNKMLDINLKGVFWVSKYAIPKMNKGGNIINISSLAGIKSFENASIYCMTKAAVISLTKTLAVELADRKIRVNNIAPGIIETPIWGKIYGKNGGKLLKESGKDTLLKRAGTPEEIAHATVFLCENDYTTGQTISVDGGESIQ